MMTQWWLHTTLQLSQFSHFKLNYCMVTLSLTSPRCEKYFLLKNNVGIDEFDFDILFCKFNDETEMTWKFPNPSHIHMQNSMRILLWFAHQQWFLFLMKNNEENLCWWKWFFVCIMMNTTLDVTNFTTHTHFLAKLNLHTLVYSSTSLPPSATALFESSTPCFQTHNSAAILKDPAQHQVPHLGPAHHANGPRNNRPAALNNARKERPDEQLLPKPHNHSTVLPTYGASNKNSFPNPNPYPLNTASLFAFMLTQSC